MCSFLGGLCWVINPYRAAFAIQDVRGALIERAQTTLRDVCGTRNLQNLLTDREGVAAEIAQIVEASAEKWGVSVESILIKDVVVPADVQAALSSAAQARRVGEAKVITARAEAADLLSSPAAIQIRQLETLQSMAKNAGSRVIFVPMGMDASSLANIAATQHAMADGMASGRI
ncbi:hypothetical protein JCM10212_004841 [Sporobolomyces blumeae]